MRNRNTVLALVGSVLAIALFGVLINYLLKYWKVEVTGNKWTSAVLTGAILIGVFCTFITLILSITAVGNRYERWCHQLFARLLVGGLKGKRRNIFAVAVANSVIRQRAAGVMALGTGSVASYFFLPAVSLWCEAVLVIASAVLAADCLLVWLRLGEGAYGDNDLEVLEAASFVLRQNSSGKGPGRYDHVFAPARTRASFLYGGEAAEAAGGLTR